MLNFKVVLFHLLKPSGLLPYWFWRLPQPCKCGMICTDFEAAAKEILLEVF